MRQRIAHVAERAQKIPRVDAQQTCLSALIAGDTVRSAREFRSVAAQRLPRTHAEKDQHAAGVSGLRPRPEPAAATDAVRAQRSRGLRGDDVTVERLASGALCSVTTGPFGRDAGGVSFTARPDRIVLLLFLYRRLQPELCAPRGNALSAESGGAGQRETKEPAIPQYLGNVRVVLLAVKSHGGSGSPSDLAQAGFHSPPMLKNGDIGGGE